MKSQSLEFIESADLGTESSVLGTSYSVLESRPFPATRRYARGPGFKERLLLRGARFLQRLFGCRGKDCFGILRYQRVSEILPGIPQPTWNVTPERFRQQLAGLLECGFEAWPLQEILSRLKAGCKIPRQAFVITFDGGYECVYTKAFPILRELELPATIFLATAYLDSREPFPCDDWLAAGEAEVPADSWRPLSWDQCLEMHDSGLVELAAHTHTHNDFCGRPAELLEDLEQNVREIQTRVPLSRASFAFPRGVIQGGYASGELSRAVRAAGLACSLSTEPELIRLNQDPFTWSRFAAQQDDTAATLAAKLGGWTSALRGIERALACRLPK
jgi:peptidoglycan/xylan/chitin deacetylase (PgdA/CDA1 family)